MHLEPADVGADDLRRLGFEVRRFKTGTPCRLNGRSIDFSKCERQDGDEPALRFSFRSEIEPFSEDDIFTLNRWSDPMFHVEQLRQMRNNVKGVYGKAGDNFLRSLSRATSSTEMHPDLYELCQSVFQTAADRRLAFKAVGILLILDNLDNITRSRSLKVHSSNFESLHSTARSILDEAMEEAGPVKVRRLGVRLSDLQSSAGQNTMLDFMGSGG